MKVWIAFLALLGGCGSLEGEVRNAATGKPVAGALVKMSTIGWGRRNGQLVWDAETIHESRADEQGRFMFDGIDGGGRLQVQSAAGNFDHGSLCPQSPLLVWVGGPNSNLKFRHRLVFADALGADDKDRAFPPALARDFGLSASGSAFGQGNTLRISAKGGLAYVRGTGTVPATPDANYVSAIDIDLSRDCGWLFISDGKSPVAVIEVRSPGGRQSPGGPWIWSMSFAPLPSMRPNNLIR